MKNEQLAKELLKARVLYDIRHEEHENNVKEWEKKNNLDEDWYKLDKEYLKNIGLDEINAECKAVDDVRQIKKALEDEAINLMCKQVKIKKEEHIRKFKTIMKYREKGILLFLEYNLQSA